MGEDETLKPLAQSCDRTNASVELTKTEAAQQQLEGAIANLFLGNWACAITLAGAAEIMLYEVNENVDLFKTAKAIAPEHFNINETQLVNLLNERRDWLKHRQPEKANSMEFRQEDAIVMILRAYTRLYAVTHAASENMDTFETWFREKYPDWLSVHVSQLFEAANS
jgi:hypothetical protein